jgi:hypothetical protein
MLRSQLLALSLLVACTPHGDPSPNEGSEDPTPDQITVDATVQVLDPMSGAGMADVTVQNSAGDSNTTDSEGRATVTVPGNATFEVLLQRDGALDHLLFGPTSDLDFDYITFMSTESLFSTVQSMLGVSTADGTGMLVVGIDYDDLSPAVGASAAIDLAHDSPWLLGNMGASFGDTIGEGVMGMVAFPNVEPGSATITVTPPEGTECTAFPGNHEMPPTPVGDDRVTVVTYHCR